jgi:outer membrane protein
MKNRVLTLMAMLCVAAFPGLAAAQSGGKVGVINIQAAIAATQEGKKAFADLQKKYQPQQAELQRQQQEIQQLQEDIQRKATTLSDEESRRLQRELEDKQKVFKRTSEDANTDFSQDRDDAISRIGQKMVKVISDYAEQNGLSLVIDGGQIPIYYAANGVDITQEIVKRFDQANPVADAGTTPAPAPAAAAPATKPAAPKK